jgi:hypothetical protein
VWTSNYYPRDRDPDIGLVLYKKFLQTLDTDIYNTLNIVAKENGIPVEELLRIVIVPDWMAIVSANAPRRNARLANSSRLNAKED